jgi:hypothetical protein
MTVLRQAHYAAAATLAAVVECCPSCCRGQLMLWSQANAAIVHIRWEDGPQLAGLVELQLQAEERKLNNGNIQSGRISGGRADATRSNVCCVQFAA